MKTLTAKILLDYLLNLADTKDLSTIPVMFIEKDFVIQAQTQHLVLVENVNKLKEESILYFETQCTEVIVIGSLPEID